MKPRKIQRYGWVRDLPDHRDYVLSFNHLPRPTVPHFDLTHACPPVYDQGQLGSCTANAILGMDEFVQMKEGMAPYNSSRLFLYYCERAMEGTVGQDSGAKIRDGMACLATVGAPPETVWPYDISKFADTPPQAAYQQASQHKSISYWRVPQTLQDMTGCLLSGYPFVFGFTVYDSFESSEVAKTGVVPMPGSNESVLGGHAVMCVGFDMPSQRFIVRNSWGTGWGMNGYFTMPFSYMTSQSLASDFWTLRKTQ